MFEFSASCCCAPSTGCCPCQSSLRSSYLLEWDGFVEIEAMSCAEYFSTAIGCASSVASFSVADPLRIELPQVAVPMNISGCQGFVDAQFRTRMERRYLSFYDPLQGANCTYDTLDTVFYPSYRVRYGIGYGIFPPRRGFDQGCTGITRDYWLVSITVCGVTLRWRSVGGYPCNPSNLFPESAINFPKYCLSPGSPTAALEAVILDQPPAGQTWAGTGFAGATNRNKLRAFSQGQVRIS